VALDFTTAEVSLSNPGLDQIACPLIKLSFMSLYYWICCSHSDDYEHHRISSRAWRRVVSCSITFQTDILQTQHVSCCLCLAGSLLGLLFYRGDREMQSSETSATSTGTYAISRKRVLFSLSCSWSPNIPFPSCVGLGTPFGKFMFILWKCW
jgi:hypothetical protein